MRKALTLAATTTALLIGVGCGGSDPRAAGSASGSLPRGGEQVKNDPADFTTKIDNPYWPMKPGSRWTYRETGPEGDFDTVVTVTGKTKRMANGVTARDVRDEVRLHGTPVELTDDFYAQDRAGNIWYMGESTAEYEHGKVKSREGSFEAGRDGAQGGVAIPARPRPGLSYRQEYRKGQAEDRARVLSLDEQAEVPAGHFQPVLLTHEDNPLEPKVVEYKLYARGVGPVLVLAPSGKGDTERLISYRRG